jgi:hypothetical protein
MLASLVYNHYIETRHTKDKAMKTNFTDVALIAVGVLFTGGLFANLFFVAKALVA